MPSCFLPRTAGHEDDPAIVRDAHVVSWGELEGRLRRIANNLAAAGVAPPDRVAVMAGNCVEYPEVIAGAVRAGAMVVPINWHLTVPEAAYILADAGARVLFTDAEHAQTAHEAAAQAGLRAVHVFGDGYEAWRDAGRDEEPANRLAGGPMFYTSGTTGRPKGVWRGTEQGDIGQCWTPWREHGAMWGYRGPGVHLVATPIYHAAPFANVLFGFAFGQTIAVQPRFEAQRFLADVQRYRATTTHIVPTQMIRLLRLEPEVRARYDLSSLEQVFHGAAPCPVWVKEAMIEWFGPVIIEYFASSEGTGPVVATSEEALARPGTVGRCPPGIELSVVDEAGNDLPAGEIGVLYFHRPDRPPPDYHNAPDKTRESRLPDGRFTVGDVGWVDADGYVFLADRKIDMIISGGANVYPAEVEAALSEHPEVADCAVFGVPDPEWGETVKGAVVLVPGASADEPALIDWCRERIAGFKCPRTIDFLDALPREASGKLKKRLLRDPYWERVAREG